MNRRGRVSIGEAARSAQISVKMARHYESIGLLPPTERGRGGTRLFTESDVHMLRFIARARMLGFPLRTVRKLLSLWQNPERSNVEVQHLAERHVRDMRNRREALETMIKALQELIEACAGDGRPACPILDDLASPYFGRGRKAA
ncbi:MAG: MerR family DNA-binding protein [Reyranella sp.]|nr:MerR family DNA-binding protein [Reyranella sp.]